MVVVMSDEENVKKRNDVKGMELEQAAQKRATVDEVKQRSIASTKKINESRIRKKGAMSFDEEELVALKNNRTAALTANLSLESADSVNTKLAVPVVKKISDEVSESVEDDDKDSDWSNGGEVEPLTSGKPKMAKNDMKDPAMIFDALEKPDTLDPKEESINRKADLRNDKKEDTSLIFDALEKPETVDPQEELDSAAVKTRTRRSIGGARGVTSLTSIRPVLGPVRISESLKIKKFPVMPRLPFAKLRRDISLRRSRKSCAKGESKRSERPLKLDWKSSSRSSTLELETLPSQVEAKQKKRIPPTLPLLVRSEVAAGAAGSSKTKARKKTEQSQRKDGLQKSVTTEVVECTSQTLSGKELNTAEAFSSQTITSKKSQSFSIIMEEPPRTHYKFVNIKVNLSQKQLDVNLSENLVIIFIQITSPLFYHLVVGDQITEVDGVVPNDLRGFFNTVESATGEWQVTLGVVRPWNVRPPTPKRMAPVFPLKKHCYLIVELPLIKKMRAGYEFQSSRGRLHFTKVEPQTMGAFAFLVVDRIIDVDSDLIPNQVNMVSLKNRIRAVQERDGCCTFLVERPSSLHHISNPSCVAMKAPATGDDVEMADDAVEIGAREAFKHTFAKDKHRNTPVYGARPKQDTTIENEQLVTAVENDTSVLRRPRRRKKRTLKIGKNPKEKAIPSDVKQGTYLSKTSETSLRKLVTKFISKTFTR